MALPLSSPFARPGPREQQRAATRERIYCAALDEFARVGFERASVAEIARAAGVSRPSFYAHFPTKDHVLFELQWRLSQELIARLTGAKGLREMLDRLVEALIEAEASVADHALFREMLSVFVRRPIGLVELDDDDIPVLGEIIERFEQARARDELAPGMDPERAARLCLTGVFGHMLGMQCTPSERREDLRALFSLYVAGGD